MSGFKKLLTHGPAYFIGKGGELKELAGSKEGSVLSGRALLQGGPKDQDMEGARTFDVFGSPATAGGNQQTTARTGAALYGLFAGGAAMMGGGMGGSTSASAAPTSGTTGSPFAFNHSYAGDSVGSGAPTASGAGWQDYARHAQMPQQQGQGEPQQVEPEYTEEDQYWTGRGMQLRQMADRAVQRYLS
jgi:hypothetical protein